MDSNAMATAIAKLATKKGNMIYYPRQSQPSASLEDCSAFLPSMPPIECFMRVDLQNARAHFFESVTAKDVVVGVVSAVQEGGLIVMLLGFDCGKVRDIAKLHISAFCPSYEIPLSAASRGNPVEQFRVRDRIRGMVIVCNKQTERITISLRQDVLPRELEHFKLGLISDDDFPLYIRKLGAYNNQSYDELLRSDPRFNNPGVITHLSGEMGISEAEPPSLFLGLHKCNIPKEEFADALRTAQAKRMAVKTVAEGIKYFRQGNHVAAMQQLNKALSIHPDNADALVARGALYANNENFDRALEDFAAAIKSEPNHQNAKKYMFETLLAKAKLLEESNELLEAISVYESAEQLFPASEEVKECLERIKLGSLIPLTVRQKSRPTEKTELTKSAKKPEMKIRRSMSSSSSSYSSSSSTSSSSSPVSYKSKNRRSKSSSAKKRMWSRSPTPVKKSKKKRRSPSIEKKKKSLLEKKRKASSTERKPGVPKQDRKEKVADASHNGDEKDVSYKKHDSHKDVVNVMTIEKTLEKTPSKSLLKEKSERKSDERRKRKSNKLDREADGKSSLLLANIYDIEAALDVTPDDLIAQSKLLQKLTDEALIENMKNASATNVSEHKQDKKADQVEGCDVIPSDSSLKITIRNESAATTAVTPHTTVDDVTDADTNHLRQPRISREKARSKRMRSSSSSRSPSHSRRRRRTRSRSRSPGRRRFRRSRSRSRSGSRRKHYRSNSRRSRSRSRGRGQRYVNRNDRRSRSHSPTISSSVVNRKKQAMTASHVPTTNKDQQSVSVVNSATPQSAGFTSQLPNKIAIDMGSAIEANLPFSVSSDKTKMMSTFRPSLDNPLVRDPVRFTLQGRGNLVRPWLNKPDSGSEVQAPVAPVQQPSAPPPYVLPPTQHRQTLPEMELFLQQLKEKEASRPRGFH